MWTTSFKRDEQGVAAMSHDFGNQVSVVTDLREQTIRRMHGDICVKEYTADPEIGHYLRYLEEVDMEINSNQQPQN